MKKGTIEMDNLNLFVTVAMIVAFIAYAVYMFLLTGIKVKTAEAPSFAASYVSDLLHRGGGQINLSSLNPVDEGKKNCKYEVVLRGLWNPYPRQGRLDRVSTVDFGDILVYDGTEAKLKRIRADVYGFPQYFCYFQYVWESGNSLNVSACNSCKFRIFHDNGLVCVDDGDIYCKALDFPVTDYEGPGYITISKAGGKVVIS